MTVTTPAGSELPGQRTGTHVAKRHRLILHIKPDVLASCLLFWVLVCLFFVLFLRNFMPARFSYDAEKIQQIALGVIAVPWDESYQRVGDLYRVLELANAPGIAGAIGFGLYCVALLPVLRTKSLRVFTFPTFLLCLATLLLAAVFLGTFSKDFLVAPIAAIATWSGRSIGWDVALVGTMSIYGMLFREYWLIVAVVYLALRIMTQAGLSYGRLAFVVGGSLAGLAVLFPIALNVPLTYFRDLANTGRIGSPDAETIILSYLPIGGLIGEWLNALLTILLFIAPVPLLLLATPYHAVLFGFITFMWARYLLALHQAIRNGTMSAEAKRSIALIVAFTTIQAVFEPDYGSYLRHFTPLFPAMILAMLEVDRFSRAHTIPSPKTDLRRPLGARIGDVQPRVRTTALQHHG